MGGTFTGGNYTIVTTLARTQSLVVIEYVGRYPDDGIVAGLAYIRCV